MQAGGHNAIELIVSRSDLREHLLNGGSFSLASFKPSVRFGASCHGRLEYTMVSEKIESCRAIGNSFRVQGENIQLKNGNVWVAWIA